jgi:hypothetical protein
MKIDDLVRKLAAFPGIEEENQPKYLFNNEPDVLEHTRGVRLLGNMPRKRSLEIPRSPLGIGFETLDRDTFDPAFTYDLLGESGVKFARCQTGWMKCEKTPGVYDFAWLDDVVDNLARRGVETWFCLCFGHPAYTPSPLYDGMRAQAEREGTPLPGRPRGYVGEVPYLHGDTAMAAWKRYVAALCEHFKGRVRKFEVWNEADAKVFWQHGGQPSDKDTFGRARDYTEFVRLTAEVVREIVPGAEIIADVAQPTARCIQGLGRAKLADVIDVFSIHLYTPLPEAGLREMVDYIRANLRRSDGRELRIMQGESGRATGKCSHFAFPTQLGQARFMARRYLGDYSCGMELSSFFTVTDFLCYYADGSDQYYGIIDGKTHRPKLAYHTLCHLAWLFDGLETAPDNLALLTPLSNFMVGSRLPYTTVTATFRRKGVPLFAVWSPEHVEISMPLLFGRFRCVAAEYPAIPDPVILDPVRGKVWDASGMEHAKPGNADFYGEAYLPFPVANSPLILTDASIFDELP